MFGKDGDTSLITAKTSNPSNVYLEVAIMYRIKEEYLHEIYKKWPTKNNKRDYILFAKVNLYLYLCRMQFKKCQKTSLTTTSLPSVMRFKKLWDARLTTFFAKTMRRWLLFSL